MWRAPARRRRGCGASWRHILWDRQIQISNSQFTFDIDPVIASEAKQSSFLSRCKKAGLLRRFAPRNDGRRRIPAARLRPGCARTFRPEMRAWGMPGARCTRSLACDKNKPHELVTTVHRDHPAFPHANGFNGFLRALPGDRACLSPSSAGMPADSTPASRRRDHTTSPSAPMLFVFQHCPRPPRPVPAFVTMANAPLFGTGWRRI